MSVCNFITFFLSILLKDFTPLIDYKDTNNINTKLIINKNKKNKNNRLVKGTATVKKYKNISFLIPNKVKAFII